MTQNARIRGVLAPVLTPFKNDLSPDRERLIAHCKWLLEQNCGLAVFGTTSEANSLSVDERADLLDAVVAAGVDPSRMMPGTGCCSITETVKLTSQAVNHGCAGVLMLPPFYYKNVSEEGLYRYFSEVVQRVGDARLKIYLYHIPPVAMIGITPKLVERLLTAYPDTIAGMKDSSGDWNNTKTFLDAFAVRPRPETKLQTPNPPSPGSGPAGKSQGNSNLQNSKAEEKVEAAPGDDVRAGRAVSSDASGGSEDSARAARTFDVFVGSESFLLANLRNGGAGTISATANVNPAAIHKLYAEYEKPSASPADLEDQQAKLDAVREIFGSKFPMIPALKQAISIYRNDPAWARMRPPLVELTAEQTKMLAADAALPRVIC
jgi:dihydrodipicolinate synthase/N-acetylneuraminate lyase